MNENNWQPQEILRSISFVPGSSTRVASVETDQGEGFVKTMGNPIGPHALARDYIGTKLADAYKLPTFEHSVIFVQEFDEIQIGDDRFAEAGPAFITKLHRGEAWKGNPIDDLPVVNPGDFAKLIVIDTLLLNKDRCPPPNMSWMTNYSNVFFSVDSLKDEGKSTLIAMDFTECLKCTPDLCDSISSIRFIRDDRVYGAFREFKAFINQNTIRTAIDDLNFITDEHIIQTIDGIPEQWEVTYQTRISIIDFCKKRRDFLLENYYEKICSYYGLIPELEVR